MAHPPPGTPEDDGIPDEGTPDDLAALDFGAAVEDQGTDLSVILGDYAGGLGAAEPTSEADPLAVFSPTDDSDLDGDAAPMFTVTNPSGTVTVTTYLDGRVHRIELGPGSTVMAEAVLADEIVVIAGLATQDARSAQYTVMLEGMREHGHDNAATRDFLSRDLDLPTPEQAAAARNELFTNRYAGDR